MLRAVEAAPQSRKHALHIAAEQPRGVKPKSWKDAALEQSLRVWGQLVILSLPKFPPEQALLASNPGDIPANAVAAVGAFFLMQIVGTGTTDNFHDQLWRAFDVVVCGHPRASKSRLINTQKAIRLVFIPVVQPDRRRDSRPDTGRRPRVKAQPVMKLIMVVTVGLADGRRHKHNPFDELGAAETRRGIPTALELGASQVLPIPQGNQTMAPTGATRLCFLKCCDCHQENLSKSRTRGNFHFVWHPSAAGSIMQSGLLPTVLPRFD